MIDKSLKPCPFCGNPAEIYIIPKEENPEWFKGGEFWNIRCSCDTCYIGHQIKLNCATKEMAISEWNTRRKRNKLTFDDPNYGKDDDSSDDYRSKKQDKKY